MGVMDMPLRRDAVGRDVIREGWTVSTSYYL